MCAIMPIFRVRESSRSKSGLDDPTCRIAVTERSLRRPITCARDTLGRKIHCAFITSSFGPARSHEQLRLGVRNVCSFVSFRPCAELQPDVCAKLRARRFRLRMPACSHPTRATVWSAGSFALQAITQNSVIYQLGRNGLLVYKQRPRKPYRRFTMGIVTRAQSDNIWCRHH